MGNTKLSINVKGEMIKSAWLCVSFTNDATKRLSTCPRPPAAHYISAGGKTGKEAGKRWFARMPVRIVRLRFRTLPDLAIHCTSPLALWEFERRGLLSLLTDAASAFSPESFTPSLPLLSAL